MNTLVTGANGFIGSRLVELLVQRGDTVHVLCRSTADVSHLPISHIKVCRGNILDIKSIKTAMEGCDRVYHLAAYAKNWAKSYQIFHDVNYQGLSNIITASQQCYVKKIVFTSTIMTYGPSNGVPVDESHQRTVRYFTEYERSKAEAEKLVRHHCTEGMNIVTVHPTRVFGPGMLVESNSVTKMIELYMQGKWRTFPGDGSAVGNYSYVEDVAMGHILAMENGRSGENYILGGENVSYKKFFDLVTDIIHKKYYIFPVPKQIALTFSFIEQKRAEWFDHYPVITPAWVKVFLDDWACTSEKAEREIGYKITPLREVLQTTIAWLQQLKQKDGVL